VSVEQLTYYLNNKKHQSKQRGRSWITNSEFSKVDEREVEGITIIPSTKIQANSFLTQCRFQFIRYTAVYQQQQIG